VYREDGRSEQLSAIEQVAEAEAAYHHARSIRRVLFTLAALASVAPWLRTLDTSLLPRALLNGATAVWTGLLLGALASRLEEWHLRRKWLRWIDRMAADRRHR
jgi:hypothetical protein